MELFLAIFSLVWLAECHPVAESWGIVDCPKNSCFGEPLSCDPQSNCRSMFKFDNGGNVDLYLRNFTDPFGYAAFAIKTGDNLTIDYLACVPHQQERFRASSELGQPIVITKRNLTRFVRRFDNDNYICSFSSSEVGEHFRADQVFFVNIGKLVEDLIIYDGEELFSFDAQLNTNDVHGNEEESILSSVPVSQALSSSKAKNGVFTQDESDVAFRAINAIGEMAEDEEDDFNLEKKVRSKLSKSRRQYDEDEDEGFSRRSKPSRRNSRSDNDDDEEEDDELFGNRFQKSRKHAGRQSRRYEDEDEDDEEEDLYEKESRNKKSRGRKPSRRYDEEDEDEDEDFETRLRRTRRRDDDDEEEEDEIDEHKEILTRRLHNNFKGKELSEMLSELDDEPKKNKKKNKNDDDEDDEYDDEDGEDDEEDDDEDGVGHAQIFATFSVTLVVFILLC